MEKIRPFIMEYNRESEQAEYINVIEDYCKQIQKLDSDANKFRYPMRNSIQVYFSENKRFDFIQIGNFFEEINNILDGIHSELNTMNEIKAEIEAEYRAEMMAEQDCYW